MLDVFGEDSVQIFQGAATSLLDQWRPSILHLNTERFTANKISVIQQLAYKNKLFIIFLQETHCTTTDKLVIPDFSLAGSVLRRITALPRLFTRGWNETWSISHQSNQRQNGCAYTSQDTRSLTSTKLYPSDSHLRLSQRLHTPVCMFVTSTANMSNLVTANYLQTLRAWTPGQQPTTLYWCPTERNQPVSQLTDGMSASTQTWPFSSVGQDSWLPDRHVLGKFPRSQHRRSLITPPRLKVPAYSDPVRLSQCWLEALLPSCTWIRWEIATSGHNKHREGIPRILQEPANCGKVMYPTWSSQELCAMLGHSAKLFNAPSSEPQCGLTQTEPLRPNFHGSNSKGRAMERSCPFHRRLALQL